MLINNKGEHKCKPQYNSKFTQREGVGGGYEAADKN